MKKVSEEQFSVSDLDQLVVRWFSGQLNEEEKKYWFDVLVYNRKFREQMAELAKAFRRPSWQKDAMLAGKGKTNAA